MPDGLRLEVTEYTDLTRWRWVLKDESGAFLADHEVRLDPSAERFEAFTALNGYVSWHAAPDKRAAEEARIVTGLGDWIGAQVFGDAIGSALIARRPTTVEIILPAGAEVLAYLPPGVRPHPTSKAPASLPSSRNSLPAPEPPSRPSATSLPTPVS